MLEARRPQAGLKKAGWELIGSEVGTSTLNMNMRRWCASNRDTHKFINEQGLELKNRINKRGLELENRSIFSQARLQDPANATGAGGH